MLKFKFFITFLLFITIFSTLVGCQKKQVDNSSIKDQKLLVNTESVIEKEIQDKISVTATIFPNEEVTISNKKDGKVSKIFVDLGDYVHKGQLLAQIDYLDYKYLFDESKARLESSETSLEGINNSAESIDKHSLARQAKANLDDAYIRMQRLKGLLDQKLVSQQDYDSAKAAYLAAQANYDSTITSLNKLKKDLIAMKASNSLIARGLSETHITAPLSGYIQARQISLGEYLKQGTTMFTLVQTNPLKIRASIPEKYSFAIKKGLVATFKVDPYANRLFKGIITRVAPAIDINNRTFEIEVTANNSDNALKPGLFAKLEIDLGKTHKALFVPEAAVYTMVGVNKVFTVHNDVVKEHIVTLGKEIDGKVEVINSLNVNDKVITTDLDQLSEGSIVKTTSPKEAYQQ